MTNALRVVAVLLPAFAVAPAVRAEPPKLPVAAFDQSAVAKRGYFYVGGKYVGDARQGHHAGPDLRRGAGAEGGAPALSAGADPRRRPDRDQLDGHARRPQGLGRLFRRAGLHRLHDRPADARPLGLASLRRSDPHVHGAERGVAVHRDRVSEGTWPQAKKHTQWPGDGPNKGKKGDPIFDAFYATQVETVISNEETQQRNQDAGAALLDKIGPAIVLTHSQSGAFGWLIADARPSLVKAIVAIEPARARRSRTPSSPPARPAPGDRPTSRSPMIRR